MDDRSIALSSSSEKRCVEFLAVETDRVKANPDCKRRSNGDSL
jgi:hypothetical protein